MYGSNIYHIELLKEANDVVKQLEFEKNILNIEVNQQNHQKVLNEEELVKV